MYAVDPVDAVKTLGTVKARGAWPVVENFMPDFKLPSAEMEPVQTSDYHKIRSLVLVFVGESDPGPGNTLLSDLAAHYAEIARESAEVLAVVRGTPSDAAQLKKRDTLPFPVLADEVGQVHRNYGAVTSDGRSVCEAIYVVGRFGKVYLSSRASDGPPLPMAKSILRWLYFIESKCPECGGDEPLM